MNSHAQERGFLIAGFQLEFGRVPVRAEAQIVQAIDGLETVYGAAWKGAGVNSLNRGAIQRPAAGATPENSFLYTDTHPNPDGTSTTYKAYFKRYAKDVDALRDLAHVALRTQGERDAAAKGLAYRYSEEMYNARYYEGFGATREKRILNHHRAVVTWLQRICGALEEELPDISAPALPDVPGPSLGFPATIRRGSSGAPVKTWQRVLNIWLHDLGGGLVVDGAFGPLVETATRKWQTGHQLNADGVVGPLSWDWADGVLDQQFRGLPS